MGSLVSLLRRYWGFSLLFLVFAIIYVTQVLVQDPTAEMQSKYHLDATHYHFLTLSIAVPYIIIWLIALVGFLRLRSYTNFLGKSKDGPGFRSITNGVLLLILWSPLTTLLGGWAAGYYANHPSATAVLIRLTGYINLVWMFVALWLLYKGTQLLLTITKSSHTGLSQKQMILYLAFTALYVFVTFTDSARHVASGGSQVATYYLPDWAILLTIVIPRLVMWYWAFCAVAGMILYRRAIKGAIYKEALRRLAYGLACVISVTVLLRVVQSLSTTINSWSLLLLVLLIYVLLILLAVGYILVAKGAKRLQKIEES